MTRKLFQHVAIGTLAATGFAATPSAAAAQEAMARETPTTEEFVRGLQHAVARQDREAIADMVELPLRVNGPNGSYVVRGRNYLLRRFDMIFDAPTLAAIAQQDAADVFSRDIGSMIGAGNIWFRRVCEDERCLRPGPFRMFAVNHLPPPEAEN